MEDFELLQAFIERSARAETLVELEAAAEHATFALGFRYFACGAHVDPRRLPCDAFILHTYPAAWASEFCERELYRIDPVFQHAERALLPFFWDGALHSGLTRQQRQILEQAGGFGLVHGYTVPIHLPYSRTAYRASCSAVPDTRRLRPAAYFSLHLLAYHLYQAASRIVCADQGSSQSVLLSQRERQCLELVAQGKSDWVVGKLLGISERTVHNHIERIKRRFRVATRVQAIVLALASRQISFGDVIKAGVHGARSNRPESERG